MVIFHSYVKLPEGIYTHNIFQQFPNLGRLRNEVAFSPGPTLGAQLWCWGGQRLEHDSMEPSNSRSSQFGCLRPKVHKVPHNYKLVL